MIDNYIWINDIGWCKVKKWMWNQHTMISTPISFRSIYYQIYHIYFCFISIHSSIIWVYLYRSFASSYIHFLIMKSMIFHESKEHNHLASYIVLLKLEYAQIYMQIIHKSSSYYLFIDMAWYPLQFSKGLIDYLLIFPINAYNNNL